VDDIERDRLLVEMRTDVAVIKDRMTVLGDHETRIRGLERFRFAVPGVAVLAVSVSIVTAAFAMFGS
jgi:methyl coenzyme M reductase alpha subunit